MVLRAFNRLIDKGLVFRGNRPVFWSCKQQRVMAEDEMRQTSELNESIVFGMQIASFGEKAFDLGSLYPNAKLLVFEPDPWKMLAMKSVAVNDLMTYVLAKWNDEFVIVAEKRLGEL
jgi:isoleucyl-tRNA synthetase